jgi:hypothetical protein
MRRISRMIFGGLASLALLSGVAGALLTAVSGAAPAATTAATAIEYGGRAGVTIYNPTAVEYA